MDNETNAEAGWRIGAWMDETKRTPISELDRDNLLFVPTKNELAELSRQELARLRAEVAELKRLYQLRGQALFRPCLNCGYEPKKITLADGSQEE